MKLLIDNTGLHRVHSVVSSDSMRNSISLSDAMALFHFAEHIMFADSIAVSMVEEPGIRDRTREAISTLLKHGCVSPDGDRPLMIEENFSREEYGVACANAAPFIQEDLQDLACNTALLRKVTKLADARTVPTGVMPRRVERLLERDLSLSERLDLGEMALNAESGGSLEYIVGIHAPTYRLVRGLARRTESAKKRRELAMVLNAFQRVAVNEQLARLRQCIYAPAPQRARVTGELDHLFRHAVEGMIRDVAKEKGVRLPSKLVARIEASERLPLPILAIHFLRRRRPNSPLMLLEDARVLRDDKEVVALRKWLSEFEALHGSQDLADREKAHRKLADLERSLRTLDEKIGMCSVLRVTASSDPMGNISFSLDLAGLAPLLTKLWAKLSRRPVFLAALKRDITDKDLGAVLCGMVGREIE